MKTIIKPKTEAQQATDLADAKTVSLAQQRLVELRERRGDAAVKIVMDGDEYFIRLLSYKGTKRMALQVARDGHNVLDVSGDDDEANDSFTTAVLMAGVCQKDGSNYFTREDVEDYLDEPGGAVLCAELLRAVLRFNPNVLDTPKKD